MPPKAEEAKADPPGSDDGEKVPTMADLRATVAEVVETALKPVMDRLGDSKPAAQPASQPGDSGGQVSPADIARMVDEGIAKAIGGQEKAKAEDEHRKQHEQLAAAAERTPVERPKRSRWLGNIWDKDT